MATENEPRYVVIIMSRRTSGVTHYYVVDRQRDDTPVAVFPVNTFDRVTEKTICNSDSMQLAMARKVCVAMNAIEDATVAAMHDVIV